MSRELLEFSNQIDEQFEPDNTITDELWNMVQSWLAPQSAKKEISKPEAHTADANKVVA